MLARTLLLFGTCFASVWVVGCSEAPQVAPTTASSVDAKPTPTASNRPANPIAASAHAFLDAVFAGDSARAAEQLTPAASQQMAATGQRFAPPGAGPSGFQLSDVRLLDEDHAAVECLVTGNLDGESVAESLGCLLRRIDGQWLVSGVVYEVAPDQEPIVINFEQPVGPPKSKPATQPEYVQGPNTEGQPPAARTATAPGSTLQR